MTIILFFAVLFVLILVHEWGHYIVAKKTDMQVDEFGIGFPPKLFGIRKGETEYTFNALPIGGFVRILGEDAIGGDEKNPYERSFVAKSKLAQAAVLLAGVTMNIIFAWLLFIVVFSVGIPSVVDESEATAAAQLVVTNVLPDAPAAEALLPVGATITQVQTETAALTELTPSAFSSFVQEQAQTEIVITYEIGDVSNVAIVTPAPNVIADTPEQLAVGVGLAMAEVVQKSFFDAVVSAFTTTGASLVAIVVGLSNLIIDSFTGTADFSQVAGPIGIAGMVGDAAEFGLTSLLMFTAIISLNLAVINMLPFPALDGGRLLFVAIEAVTRRPINPVWVARLNTIGFGLLMLLMIAVTWNDIVRLL